MHDHALNDAFMAHARAGIEARGLDIEVLSEPQPRRSGASMWLTHFDRYECIPVIVYNAEPSGSANAISRIVRKEEGDATETTAALRICDELLDHRARLAERAKVIGDGKPPAWAVSVHVVGAALLTRYARTPRMLHERDDFQNDGLITTYRWHMREERMSFESVGSPLVDIVSYADPGVLTLMQELPETAVAAYVGQPIQALVDHPQIKGVAGNVRIESIRRSDVVDGGFEVNLEEVLRPLAPPPPGVDVSWLAPPGVKLLPAT